MSAILVRRPHPPVQAVRLCNRPCQLELGKRPCDTWSAHARGAGQLVRPCWFGRKHREDGERRLAQVRRARRCIRPG